MEPNETLGSGNFQNRIDLGELKTAVEKIRAEVGKVVVGQHRMIDLLIAGMLADGHILIEGVPGIAKTLTAKLIARTLSVGFARLQFTPDLMPSDVIGTSVYNLQNSTFEFKKGPVFSNIVLIDEINRAPAKTQAALFECMQEKQVTVDGKTYRLEEPFLILATQNPVEQEGTYRLPEAQLDRFLFKIEITYPTAEEETSILRNYHKMEGNFSGENVQPVLDAAKLRAFRGQIHKILIEDKLIEYIARIVNHTRNHKSLFLGASPRASIGIMTAAKAFAAISGRDFVTPEDIKFVAPSVMHHRVMLTPEKEMEGATANQVVTQIIESIEVPR